MQFFMDCVDVYSDSLVAIDAFTNQEVYFGHEESFLDQINILLDDYRFQEICHLRRKANRIAHNIAKYGLSISQDVILRFSSWLKVDVISDLVE